MLKIKFTPMVICSALLISACSYTPEKPIIKEENKKVIKVTPVETQKEEIDVINVNSNKEASSRSYYLKDPAISGKIVGDYGSGSLVRSKIRGIVKDYELLINDISSIENEIKRTNADIAASTSNYVSLLAGMTVRLQTGTTPGNPRLVSQWNQSQRALDNLSKQLTHLNALANNIDNNASLSSFLINAIHATYGISGAIEEEHEELKRIEDELKYLVSRIGRVVTSINDDISRQTTYLEKERRNIQTLALAVKKGEFFGNSIMNRTLDMYSDFDAQQAAFDMKRLSISSRFPIITIRFSDDNVDYAKMLYKAIDGAVDLKPNAKFKVVAVSPETAENNLMSLESSKDYAKLKAETVFRDMIKMGVPAKNIDLMVNTVSESVDVNEVQIFLK